MSEAMTAFGDVDYSARKHYLSETSEEKLKSIDARLAECVRKVSGICSDLNIQVIEGKRTEEEHSWLWEKGATHSSGHSPHLYGYAVDLGIFIGNRICPEAEVYDELVRGMIFAAQEVGVKLRWGGAPYVDDLRYHENAFIEDLTNDYIDTCRRAGKRPVLDIHHFEIGT
tara:strand:- start:273 stop:782 length:510 start_codon:yes stop_codon:yes gene_type:complete